LLLVGGSVFLSNSTKVVVSKQQVSSNIGARVWNLIHEPHTLGEFRATLLDEYDVDAPRLESDLHTLSTQLADKDLVEIQYVQVAVLSEWKGHLTKENTIGVAIT